MDQIPKKTSGVPPHLQDAQDSLEIFWIALALVDFFPVLLLAAL